MLPSTFMLNKNLHKLTRKANPIRTGKCKNPFLLYKQHEFHVRMGKSWNENQIWTWTKKMITLRTGRKEKNVFMGASLKNPVHVKSKIQSVSLMRKWQFWGTATQHWGIFSSWLCGYKDASATPRQLCSLAPRFPVWSYILQYKRIKVWAGCCALCFRE